MRSIIFILFFSITGYLFSQEDQSSWKIESFHFNHGKEKLHHGNQTSNNYVNTISDQSIAVHNDSNLTQLSKQKWYNYKTISAEIGLRNDDSKWRYLIGASYNSRWERNYRFQKQLHNIVDTVYAPVPTLYNTNENESTYNYYYDSLLLDSSYVHLMDYYSKTTNIFIHGELLRDIDINKYRISVGGGLSFGASIRHEIRASYEKHFSYRLATKEYEDYYPVWYADIPHSSPQGGQINPAQHTSIGSYYLESPGHTIFSFKPYIPLRVEAQIADQGFFSKVGVMASTKAGIEFQMVKGAGLSSRFFWNYNAGVFYRI